jgi:hypothetical protein
VREGSHEPARVYSSELFSYGWRDISYDQWCRVAREDLLLGLSCDLLSRQEMFSMLLQASMLRAPTAAALDKVTVKLLRCTDRVGRKQD